MARDWLAFAGTVIGGGLALSCCLASLRLQFGDEQTHIVGRVLAKTGYGDRYRIGRNLVGEIGPGRGLHGFVAF